MSGFSLGFCGPWVLISIVMFCCLSQHTFFTISEDINKTGKYFSTVIEQLGQRVSLCVRVSDDYTNHHCATRETPAYSS